MIQPAETAIHATPTFEAARSSPRAATALAVVRHGWTGKWTVKQDCRRRFVAQAGHVPRGQAIGEARRHGMRTVIASGGRAW